MSVTSEDQGVVSDAPETKADDAEKTVSIGPEVIHDNFGSKVKWLESSPTLKVDIGSVSRFNAASWSLD